jgi:aspartate ammonia-lyase
MYWTIVVGDAHWFSICTGTEKSEHRPIAPTTRTEKDLLGEKQIPFDAYYGVQTARALENFQVSGMKTNSYPDYVKAYAIVKLAAARANAEDGRLSKEKLVGY